MAEVTIMNKTSSKHSKPATKKAVAPKTPILKKAIATKKPVATPKKVAATKKEVKLASERVMKKYSHAIKRLAVR